MNGLSVVIITYNEEETIARCIHSVQGLADEVLVVDSFSTDKTKAVAESNGARVILHKFEGHIQQKNYAKEQARYDWVLSLDADEELSPELRNSIALVKGANKPDGYTMNRLNFFCGRAVKTCGWYPDTKLRLWKKSAGRWAGTNPHDRFELDQGTASGLLHGDILHHTYPTRQSFLTQREKFANISARHLAANSFPFLVFKIMFSPSFKFIRSYVFELGFTDGADGLFICFHLSREVFLKYFRAIKLKGK